jgi:hypothetical protein
MDKLQWSILSHKLNTVLNQLEILVAKQEIQMVDFTKLQSDLTAEGAAIAQAISLLTALTADIAALKVGNPADQAAVDALAAKASSDTAALVASIAANPA